MSTYLSYLLETAVLGIVLGAALAALDRAFSGPLYRWSARWVPWKAQLSSAPTAGFFTDQNVFPRAYAAAALCVLWLVIRAVLFDVDVVITMTFILGVAVMVAALVAGSYFGATFTVVVGAIARAAGITGRTPVESSTVTRVQEAARSDAESVQAAVRPVPDFVAAEPVQKPVAAEVVPEPTPVIVTPPPAPDPVPQPKPVPVESAEDKVRSFTGG